MPKKQNKKSSLKYLIGGVIITAVVIFLIISATSTSAQYYLTVDELLSNAEKYAGEQVRISGAVIGDTIRFDPETVTLTFTIANISGDLAEIERLGGLVAALHAAVSDPARNRIQVEYRGIQPDLLQNEAQAILTGTLCLDGIFKVDEILLKCPSKYAEELPEQNEDTR
jgi:cytochrome c-type biogenesis protein CcmE